ncbi:MAG: hypothetical protein ABIV28_05580 [Longimicrobiales bacterium]
MATLTEFFDSEAQRYLETLTDLLRGSTPNPDEVYRAARALRGSAQMAREDRVYRSALAFENGARAVAQGTLAWSDDIAGRVRGSIADVQRIIAGGDASDLDAVTRASVERWTSAGVEMPAGADAAAASGQKRDAVQEFRAFAAAEVDGISEALDRGVQALSAQPMDREALKTILRRQRALLGAARLDEIPVVAEILRAVEDLTRVIVKLDIGVKREWLDIFRVAREGLKAAGEPLRANQDPPPSNHVARLRHMREELLERYGTGEAVSAAGGPEQGIVQAKPMTEPPPPTATPIADASPIAYAAPMAAAAPTDEVVDVVSLQYSGAAALRRALELRADVETAVESNPDAREAVDELFDLLRLAQG